jgi:hypothetical protein
VAESIKTKQVILVERKNQEKSDCIRYSVDRQFEASLFLLGLKSVYQKEKANKHDRIKMALSLQ